MNRIFDLHSSAERGETPGSHWHDERCGRKPTFSAKMKSTMHIFPIIYLRRIILIPISSLALGSILLPAPALASCRAPDPARLLRLNETPYDLVTVTTPFTFKGRRLRWIALSFGAPPQGGLFVIDCDGRELARADIGSVQALARGPVIGGGSTVAATYVPAAGPNFKVRSVALVRFIPGSSLVTLWDHAIFDGAYFPPSMAQQSETTWNWAFGDRHVRISVRGAERVLGARPRVRRLPTEHYCFRRSLARFIPCR